MQLHKLAIVTLRYDLTPCLTNIKHQSIAQAEDVYMYTIHECTNQMDVHVQWNQGVYHVVYHRQDVNENYLAGITL